MSFPPGSGAGPARLECFSLLPLECLSLLPHLALTCGPTSAPALAALAVRSSPTWPRRLAWPP